MTFDEGRTRMPGNNGFSTMVVRPGMTFEDKEMPVRPGMTFGDNAKMPYKQSIDPGFVFLRSFIGQNQAKTPSFDVTPDINSPVIDEDIRRHNLKYGPAPTMDPIIRRNMERMKSRPSLFI